MRIPAGICEVCGRHVHTISSINGTCFASIDARERWAVAFKNLIGGHAVHVGGEVVLATRAAICAKEMVVA